ncbi:MAG TPA: NUDIX domain-containing protein [Stellaceae bacterium]|nr:NUDIX domain-containing protein [Stellaceae bacterium]
MSAHPPPVAPRPAATLLLLRDGAAGLEVLMTARHEEAGFAAGALVFPGGKVDPVDAALIGFCPDVPALDEAALVLRIAAIRETFEECGILLARGGGILLTGALLATLLDRHGASDAGFAALVAAAELELATDDLVPYAHWITPVDRPKRFDTHFFLAPAVHDQIAVHDGREAVDAVWMTPASVLAGADAGRIKLVFATRMNLLKLARSATVADALAAARGAPIVTVTPVIEKTTGGPFVHIPEAAGYGGARFAAADIPRA